MTKCICYRQLADLQLVTSKIFYRNDDIFITMV